MAPPQPSVDLNFTYPTLGNVNLPLPPALLSLDTVTFPELTIPSFDVTVPPMTLVAPGVVPYTEPEFYTSSLLTNLEANLNQAFTDGAFTGLPGPIEQNLWDRAREREFRAQAEALAELERMEAMGWSFPPGVYTDARIKISTETAYTTVGLSRDIMIKQAELTLENITKARETSVQLEGQLINYYNQVAQRTFDAAKYYTQANIEIYNASVQAYVASLEGFKTEALVYDTQIKGILAQVDVLKAQIDFEQTKANINTALVQQYKTEVDAALAVVEIYKAQLEGVQIQASVQKIVVDVYGAQIQAYIGQVNAYTAQIEGYKALVETQGVIENVYKTQVEAYTAQVNAGVAVVTALIEEYKGQILAYQAQLDGYKAQIEGMVGEAQAAASYNTAEAEIYRARVEAVAAYNQALTQQWVAILNEQEKIAELGVAAAKANGDLYIAARGLSLDASKVGAQVSAQLGAAALGAIHWANNARGRCRSATASAPARAPARTPTRTSTRAHKDDEHGRLAGFQDALARKYDILQEQADTARNTGRLRLVCSTSSRTSTAPRLPRATRSPWVKPPRRRQVPS